MRPAAAAPESISPPPQVAPPPVPARVPVNSQTLAPITRRVDEYEISRTTPAGCGRALDLSMGELFFFKSNRLGSASPESIDTLCHEIVKVHIAEHNTSSSRGLFGVTSVCCVRVLPAEVACGCSGRGRGRVSATAVVGHREADPYFWDGGGYGVAPLLAHYAPQSMPRQCYHGRRFASAYRRCRIHPRNPSYAAPELLSGAPYKSKVDVWSYGMLLYHVLTGRPPFDPGLAFPAVQSSVTAGRLAPVPQLPAGLSVLIRNALRWTRASGHLLRQSSPAFSGVITSYRGSTRTSTAAAKGPYGRCRPRTRVLSRSGRRRNRRTFLRSLKLRAIICAGLAV